MVAIAVFINRCCRAYAAVADLTLPACSYPCGLNPLGALQVKPLRRQLKTLKAWITGQRKDQSPGTRMAVPVVEVDPVFEGESLSKHLGG